MFPGDPSRIPCGLPLQLAFAAASAQAPQGDGTQGETLRQLGFSVQALNGIRPSPQAVFSLFGRLLAMSNKNIYFSTTDKPCAGRNTHIYF
jgi:hypothetical protein